MAERSQPHRPGRRWKRHHPRHRHGPGCAHEHHHRGHRLHRRLFVWFGLSILVTFMVMGGMMHLGDNGTAKRERQALGALIAARLAPVWDDPARRVAVTRELAALLGGPLTLIAKDGTIVAGAGGRCAEPTRHVTVRRGDAIIGRVGVCDVGLQQKRPPFFLGLIVGALVLWGIAGFIARWLVRPLSDVARVARQIGEGELSSRVTLRHRPADEIRELADAVNGMAARIEKQMADQRELLAAVSHEIRTPLGHMRVIAELAREGDTARLADLEREIADVDTLVDQLLASSRVEFGSFEARPLSAIDVCTRALERANLDAALLDVGLDDPLLHGDPMLLSRAIGNLLENAQRHADKVTRVHLSEHDGRVRFSVEDRGPGFDQRELERSFDSFYRGERPTKARHGSLGLGLALVRRIAEAHGGRAWAENHDTGATVSIELPRLASRQ